MAFSFDKNLWIAATDYHVYFCTIVLLSLCPPHWGVDILFLLFPPSAVRHPPSGVRRPTWFPDILGNSSYPIFTKFGMQVYWVNSLYGIAFGDDSSIAN